MDDFISAIMLTYNRENYVATAIESILSQTYRNFELILVDNGSTDRSGKICDEYAKKDARIKVMHASRGSIGYGRNLGISMAKGDYITFIDDDDVAYPEMFKLLVDLITSGNYDISTCGSHRNVDGVLSDKYAFDGLRVLEGEQGVKELLNRELYNSSNPTKLFRRYLLDTIRYEEKGKYDDIAVLYKIFAEAKTVIASGQPQYCFYRHKSNNSIFTTNSKLLSPSQLEEYFQAFSIRTQYLTQRFPKEQQFFKYTEWSYLLSMYCKIRENNLTNCEKQSRYIQDVLVRGFDDFYNNPYIKTEEINVLSKLSVLARKGLKNEL